MRNLVFLRVVGYHLGSVGLPRGVQPGDPVHVHERRGPGAGREPPAPGGTFTFSVVVINTSAEPVTITSLIDDVYGNIAREGTCATAIGRILTADPDEDGPRREGPTRVSSG